MKRTFLKTAAIILSIVMVLGMFSACGSKQEAQPAIDEIVDAAVKAALENMPASATAVTFDADGQLITLEDVAGKSIQQMLDLAQITLNDGDILAVAPDQSFSGNLTIQVLRRSVVTVVTDSERYTVVLVGGTVADAIEAVGVELAENHIASHALEDALVDGMEIIISEKEVPTEPEEESDDDSGSDNNDYNSGSNSGSNTGSNTGSNSGSGSDDSGNSGDSGSSDDSGTEGGRYVVDVVYYYDCDDSGHGVKVITYSDGTQEEVYF